MSDFNDKKYTETVNTLLCLQKQQTLILPDVVIAEILDDPVSLTGSDIAWYLGDLDWRNLQIPIVLWDKLYDPNIVIQEQANKLIVINALSESGDFSYYALVTFSTPRMARIDNNMLQDEESQGETFIKSVARLNGEVVMIPDLLAIESEIAKIKQTMSTEEDTV